MDQNGIEMEEKRRLLNTNKEDESATTEPTKPRMVEVTPIPPIKTATVTDDETKEAVVQATTITQSMDNNERNDSHNKDELLRAFLCEDMEESEIITLVYQYKDDVSYVEDDDGNTLLHLAVRKKGQALVDTLLLPQYNIDKEKTNADGLSAIDIALKDWNQEYDPIAASLVKATENERVRELFKSENRFQTLVEKKFTETLSEVLNSMIDNDENGHTAYYDLLETEVTEGNLTNQKAGNPIIQKLMTTSPFTYYQIFALNKCVDVVNNDLYRLLTIKKWRMFARKLLVLQIALFLLSIFFLTYIAITSIYLDDIMVYDGPVQQARLGFEIITFVYMVGLFLNEVAQLIRSKRKYFLDFHNVLEMLSSILFILILPLRFTTTDAHWCCFSVGYGLYMTGIFKYAIVFRSTGVQTQILGHILKHDVVQFSMLFFVVNFAFAGGFYLMLRADQDILKNLDISTFPGILYAGARTLTEGGPVIEYTGKSAFGVMSTLVLLLFLFMTVVILLNILIAQVNNTYQRIQDDADKHYELNLARYVAWIEINTCIFPCFKVCRDRRVNIKESIKDLSNVLDRKRPTLLENIKLLMEHLIRKQTMNAGQMAKFISKLTSIEQATKGSQIEEHILKETENSAKYLLDELGSIEVSKRYYERTVKDLRAQLNGTEGLLQTIWRDLNYGPTSKSTDRTRGLDMEAKEVAAVKDHGHDLLDAPILTPAHSYVDKIVNSVENTDELYATINQKRQEEILGLLKAVEKKCPGKLHKLFLGDEGETIMHIAARRGFYYVVEFLINSNAPINQTTLLDQRLPLQKALDKPYDDVAELIASNMDKKELRSLFCRENTRTPPKMLIKEYLENGCPKFLKVVLDAMIDCGEVYYNILESDSEGFEPNDLEFNDTIETVFQSIARIGNKDTISHRVLHMLVEKKWKNFARGRFFFQMVMYLVSLATLTVSAVLGVISDDVKGYTSPMDGTRAVFEIAMYAYATLMCLPHDLWKLKRMKFQYVLSLDVFDGISTLLIITLLPVRYIDVRVHWYIFAVGYLLWSLRIFKYAAIFRTLGAYAQTLWMIIKRDVIQFSALFIVVNIAFSGTYFLALKADKQLNGNTEISTFHGVFYAGLQTVTKGGPVIDYTDGHGIFSTAIQMMFLFVTLVILLNILIAQLSNTYTNIQEDAHRELQVRMARIIVSVQHGVMPLCRQTDVKNFYIPNEPVYDAMQEQDGDLISEIDDKVQHLCDKQVSNQLKMIDIESGIKDLDKTTMTLTEKVCEQGEDITRIGKTFLETEKHSKEILSGWTKFSTRLVNETENMTKKQAELWNLANMILDKLNEQHSHTSFE